MSISLIFDVAIVAILLLCLIVGGHRGFIRSLLSVAIFALALLGSGIVANLLSDPVTEWATPLIEQQIIDRLSQGHSQEAMAAASDSATLAQIVDFDAITGMARQAMERAVEAGKSLLDGAVTGMVHSLVYAVVFLVSFLVLTLLLRLVTSPLHLAERAPVLGTLNRLSGAALGLALGILAMFAAASILQWTGLVDAATLKNTYLLRYFTQHSPMELLAML